MRYIIHLKVEYYEHQKKEKKADVKIGIEGCMDDAKKTFAMALEKSTSPKIVLVKEEYTNKTFTTAVIVDFKEEKLEEALAFFRSLDVVDVIEPETMHPDRK